MATISPGPEISKPTRFFARGTSQPSLSATVTVINERSCPSDLIVPWSAFIDSREAGPVVFHHVFGPALAVPVGDDFQFARLVFHIVPAESIFVSAFLPAAKRAPVQKQFPFVA